MLIDDFLGYFSPNKKLERLKARKAIERIEKKRGYEGATVSKRGESWNTTALSANAEIASALPRLRNRSRDLVRNNSYAARAVQVIANNVVGKGIRLAIDSKNETQENRVREAWRQWAESTECDYDGIHDFYGIQLLVMRCVVESGECLIRRRRVRRNDSSTPIKLQVLEPDFIASDLVTGINLPKDHKIIQGIEFDGRGRRVAYHLYETHPGNAGIEENSTFNGAYRHVRVAASDVLHVFSVARAGQVRGVPWLAPAMQRLKDFSDYEQATLVRQKLASAYMAFIKDIELPDVDDQDEIELISSFEPGLIEFLPPGKDIVLSDPPQVNENYADYTRVMLQSVASSIGVSYEALTGNLKDINYSSSRMGWLEFQRNIDVWRSSIMKNMLNNPVWDWWTEAAGLMGINSEAVKSSWIPPRREMIDITKEIPAMVEAVDAKFKTLSEVIRESGKHPEDHFEELKAEKELLDKLGLTVETMNTESSNPTKKSVKQSNDNRLGASRS